MNKLQKLFFILILVAVLEAPLMAMADNYGLDATQKATGNALPETVAGSSDVAGIVGTVVSSLLGLIGVVFFILVLYAGLKWMLAMGNSEDVTKAKDILINAGIGLIIVAASYAITRFVFTSLGAGSGAGGGGGSGPETSCKEDSDCKVGNMVCSDEKKCVTICEYNYSASGVCVNKEQCVSPKISEAGLCPGGNNIICCHNATN